MTVKRYEMNHKGLPEDDANGSFVLWEDYAELQRQLTAYETTVTNLTAQVQELAVESGRLRSAAEFSVAPDMWVEQHDGMLEYRYVEWYVDVLKAAMETPATDAALAEIRAQGVDMAIEHLTKKFEGTGGLGVPVMALEHLASELRKEQGK